MYLFLYTMLLAGGGALAHFRGYTTRDLFNRDEPRSSIKVGCPVCNYTWPALEETCYISENGWRYKECIFGTYINQACDRREDCRRGLDKKCSTINDDPSKIDIRCAKGYHCDDSKGVCVGGDFILNSVELYYLSPSSLSGTDKSHSIDLHNPKVMRSSAYSVFEPL